MSFLIYFTFGKIKIKLAPIEIVKLILYGVLCNLNANFGVLWLNISLKRDNIYKKIKQLLKKPKIATWNPRTPYYTYVTMRNFKVGYHIGKKFWLRFKILITYFEYGRKVRESSLKNLCKLRKVRCKLKAMFVGFEQIFAVLAKNILTTWICCGSEGGQIPIRRSEEFFIYLTDSSEHARTFPNFTDELNVYSSFRSTLM